MGNVRRQGHFSQLIQNLLKNAFILELDQAVSFLHYINDLAFQDPVSKNDLRARAGFFARLYQTFPDIIFFPFQKKNLNKSSCLFLVTIKTGRISVK